MDTTFAIQCTVAKLKRDNAHGYNILIAHSPFNFGWADINAYRHNPARKVECEAAVYAMAYQMVKKGILVQFISIT